MRPEPGLVARGEAERVLEVGPAGEHGAPHGPAQVNGPGHVPPRAAEDRGPPRDHARDRVVAAVLDLAVVGEEEVGDAGQAGEGLAVPRRHRLLGEVAGGHDEGAPRGFQEEVVERRVGQQQAHQRVARRDLGREAAPGPPPHEDDGTLDRGEEALLGGIHDRQGARVVEGEHHDRERLLVALLPLAEPPHGRGRRGVAREVVAAQALHRHDPSLAQGQRRRRDRVGAQAGGLPGRAQQPHARPAARAGDRLGVEPPVGRVFVLPPAVGAHREAGHRRGRAVVRHVAGDRVAGPAVRAVREGVGVAAVGRVPHLAQALRAGGEVGRDRDPADPLALARDDGEPGDGLRRDGLLAHLAETGRRRGLAPQAPEEGVQGLGAPEGLDRDPAGVVAHPPGDALLDGEAVDPGAEAHPLDRPRDLDASPFDHGSRSCLSQPRRIQHAPAGLQPYCPYRSLRLNRMNHPTPANWGRLAS